MTHTLPPIPLEDVARYPLPGAAAPVRFSFSPDDRLLAFLASPPGSLVRKLYALDLATGERRLLVSPPGEGATEDNISLEEKLRRERLRQIDLGVTDYAWSKQGALLLPLPDGVYVQDPGGSPRLLVGVENGPVLDPRFSPDGAWVSYVQGSELWVIPAAGGQARQLTFGAAERGWTHGLAEYIAQEEMNRHQGYWWSRDSRMLAFEEVDETHIPIYRIVHQGKDQVGEGAQEDHRYPFAGQPNAVVRLGIVRLEGVEQGLPQPVWMDLGSETDMYLARVDWMHDGRLAVQVENRQQTRLDLLAYDPFTGKANLLLTETSDVWINLHDLLTPLKDGRFVWASERSGFRHLYLHEKDGTLVRQLTTGEGAVEWVAGIDEQAGEIYFQATLDSPLELHFYAVSLEGGPPRRISSGVGRHTIIAMDHTCGRYVENLDTLDHPARITLRALPGGEEILTIHEPDDPRLAELALEPPEIVTLRNRDGVQLYGAIYRPPASFGPGPYPTIVYVYGGPHAQMVGSHWGMTISMRAQALRRRGFLVFALDNRGSYRRGLAFEGYIKHRMGDPEVDDQVDGVRWLVEQGLADPARVGIYGWSYGGYMAAMCLARAPETFRAAVAGAPVTHWDGYDTCYTERYMGTPQSNPRGYEESSVMHHVQTMTGRLMLVHGLIDENVHFRHTARLINALIAARKTYELLLFPDERHLPRKLADRVFMEEQILAFFERELRG